MLEARIVLGSLLATWAPMVLAASDPLAPTRAAQVAATSRTAPAPAASENFTVEYPGGAAPQDIESDLDADDESHHRVAPGCAALSDVGYKAKYDTVTMTNTGARTAVVTARLGLMPDPRATCPEATPFDPFLAVYDHTFDPGNALSGCVAASDDGIAGGDRCPTLSGIEIEPGSTRVFVLTSSLSSQLGSYGLVFDSTLPVTIQAFSVD